MASRMAGSNFSGIPLSAMTLSEPMGPNMFAGGRLLIAENTALCNARQPVKMGQGVKANFDNATLAGSGAAAPRLAFFGREGPRDPVAGQLDARQSYGCVRT